jgi:hypothetical protein
MYSLSCIRKNGRTRIYGGNNDDDDDDAYLVG